MFRPLVTGEELQQLERLEIARGLPSLTSRISPLRWGSVSPGCYAPEL